VRSPAKPDAAPIEVVAGGLFDGDGRVLIAQRPAGKSLAGRWEFPGGKLAAGEEPYAGLVRELREELGIEVRGAKRLMRYAHQYPGRTVSLDMWIVTDWSGDVHGHDGQALAWVEPARLGEHDILEADKPIVEALQRRTAECVDHATSRNPTTEK
jgi:8-oxo-dGTP diphosphatase